MVTILISVPDASGHEMMNRDHIPKVVASEMGTVQTFVMKPA